MGAIQDLMTKIMSDRTNHGAWQYLEVKQMSDILVRQRDKARQALRDYRQHKRTHMAETDAIEKLYLGYEGIFMRDHLRDALRLYVMVNRDFHAAYNEYMKSLGGTANDAGAKSVTITLGHNVIPLSSRRKNAA